MTLTQLEYIVALDKHRSFIHAAKNCFVTQPTLSIQVQKLEDHLGVILFDRAKQPIVPTDIGKKIINAARAILRESSKIEQIILDERESLQGVYRLGIIPSVASFLIPLFLKEFISKYPNVKLVISELQTHQLIKKLEENELDAGIAATPLSEKNLIELSLYREPFLAYLNAGHKLIKEKKIKITDLDQKNILLMGEGHCFRNQVSQLCKIKESVKGKKNLEIESNNFMTMVKLVNQGFGVTVLPQSIVQQLSKSDQDKKVKKFKGEYPTREVSLILKSSVIKKNINDALIEAILKNIPKEMSTIRKGRETILDPLFVS